MSPILTTEERRENFLNFASDFSEETQKAITLFYDHIVDEKVIPYKIKNRQLIIDIADLPAISVRLIFHNVIIEDGRHPKEILLTCLSGEKVTDARPTGTYRIGFINGLITEGIIKESSFTFDDVTADIQCWNYHLSRYPFSSDSDKIPWRLVFDPVKAFVDKWKLLGEYVLSTEEIEHCTTLRFIYTLLDIYLDEKTSIGYGHSSVRFSREKVLDLNMTKGMILAGKRLFSTCKWPELADAIDNFADDKIKFFQDFAMKISHKEGRILYDYCQDVLEKCSVSYEQNPSFINLHGPCFVQAKDRLNSLFASKGFEGTYPTYVRREKPHFLESSFVYEQKYTYINEKQKVTMYTFIESIIEDGLQLNAICGQLFPKNSGESSFLNQAVYCCFCDEGRRSAHMTEGLFFTEEMPLGEVDEDTVEFFKRCVMMNH